MKKKKFSQEELNKQATDYVAWMFGAPKSSEWASHWNSFIRKNGVVYVNKK